MPFIIYYHLKKHCTVQTIRRKALFHDLSEDYQYATSPGQRPGCGGCRSPKSTQGSHSHFPPSVTVTGERPKAKRSHLETQFVTCNARPTALVMPQIVERLGRNPNKESIPF